MSQEFLRNLKPFSNVSKYGAFFAENDDRSKICIVNTNDKICGQIVPSPSQSTSGMINHLRKHPNITADALMPINAAVVAKNPLVTKFATKVNQENSLQMIIAKLVCCDLLPINKIPKSEAIAVLFEKAFKAKLTPHLIWSNVNSVEMEAKAKLCEIFKQSNVSLSCDDWTSRSSQGYCNVIATVKNNAKRIHYSLGLIALKKTDGFSLARKILERVREFSIHSKFITTDGAANMESMAKQAGLLQQKCLVHGLQLIVNEMIFFKKDKFGLPLLEIDENDSDENEYDIDEECMSDNDEITDVEENFNSDNTFMTDIFDSINSKVVLKQKYMDAIKKVRSLMVLFKRSTKQRDHLRNYTSLAPVIDVKTRWNSTYYMLKRYLVIVNDIRKAALDSESIRKRMVDDDDTLRAIKGLFAILKPFDEATKYLSESKTNLHRADLILQMLIDSLNGFEQLQERTITRIRERRAIWSDIVLYLKNDSDDIALYNKPEYSEIEEIFNIVIIF